MKNIEIRQPLSVKPSQAFLMKDFMGHHSATAIIDKPPADWNEFQELAGLKGFRVSTRPASYISPRGVVAIPGVKVMVNESTGESYGTMTRRKIVHPTDFDFMMDTDVVGDIIPVAGGYRYGGQFFGLNQLPDYRRINGKNLYAYLLWIGGMNCTFGGGLLLAPHKCLNVANVGNIMTFKHDGDVRSKLHLIKQSFEQGVEYAKQNLDLFVNASKVTVNKEQVLEYIVDATDGLAKWEGDRELNRTGVKIQLAYRDGLGAPEARWTAYDLLQSATHVGNHERTSRKESKFTNAINGGAAKDNRKYFEAMIRLLGKYSPSALPDSLAA